ncbi:MAG: M20/M25/M40 family metallo-hydrolase [Firmicutes bacterium]|nr:M20/M25/M40 family metallo-hydrolase [Bacillota bacterium]
MKNRLKEKIAYLTSLIGVSGSEQQVMKYCRDFLMPLADEVTVLPIGDVIARFDSKKPGPKMMIAAHADEIGFTVRHISKDGFLYFSTFGGVQLKTVLASRVLINGRKGIVRGIVGVTPGHIQTVEERSKLPAIEDCYIDIGASSAEEVAAMGIEIGTTAVVEHPLAELNDPDLIMGRCIDDRAGVAILLDIAERIREMDFCGTVYLTVTVQEEVGLVGAIHASDYIKPDCFIAVDTAPCGGTPDVPERKLPTKMGFGPIITVADNTSPVSKIFPNTGLVAWAKKYAAEHDIPLQRVPAPGAGNNDAGAVNYVGCHCPAMGLVMPRRYSHTASELLHMDDLIYEYRMICGLIENNGAISFDFFADCPDA